LRVLGDLILNIQDVAVSIPVSAIEIQAEACGYGSELSKMWKPDGWSPKTRMEF
jgi:hypothetical protein